MILRFDIFDGFIDLSVFMHVVVMIACLCCRDTKAGVQYEMEQLDFRTVLKSTDVKSK